jgi:hypothetical protein
MAMPGPDAPRALPVVTSPATPARPLPLPRGPSSPRVPLVPAAPDVVHFTAGCPGCGQDAQWQQEREDTRVRATVHCDCA